ncbi:MAG: hypothetical protein DMG23_05740 [Acidobacteria bacterium]|nr:MAG: hypothetical protein DMG23_05740 [Acidobacteriota bacterium]
MPVCALLILLGALQVNHGGAHGFTRGRFSPAPQAPPQAGAGTPIPPGQATRPREGEALPNVHQPASPTAPEHYTLSPERRAKAIAYSRDQYILYFVDFVLSISIYLLLWRTRTAAAFRDWARKLARRHIAQCAIFVPVFAAAASLLRSPLDYYAGFALDHRFGLSTQSFASWLGDWAKNLAVTAVLGTLVVWIFYLVVRRAPRRWWFYFWLLTIPLALGFMLLEPFVIEPLFFKFTPLEKTRPALTARVEGMLDHAGLEVPHSRIFEMDASAKTKTLNAYVSGVGASKRVVVWDNTLRMMSEDETLLVLGHEVGHYVLRHILKEFALIELLVLGLFYLGFVALNGVVERLGTRSAVESVGDLASFPIALSVLTALSFLISPVVNGISRHFEHQADQFALEVTYGIVLDPNAAEARALQTLGEEDLADPDPHPFIEYWLYSHPPLDERIRFAAAYKPWTEGKPLELVRPR